MGAGTPGLGARAMPSAANRVGESLQALLGLASACCHRCCCCCINGCCCPRPACCAASAARHPSRRRSHSRCCAAHCSTSGGSPPCACWLHCHAAPAAISFASASSACVRWTARHGTITCFGVNQRSSVPPDVAGGAVRGWRGCGNGPFLLCRRCVQTPQRPPPTPPPSSWCRSGRRVATPVAPPGTPPQRAAPRCGVKAPPAPRLRCAAPAALHAEPAGPAPPVPPPPPAMQAGAPPPRRRGASAAAPSAAAARGARGAGCSARGPSGAERCAAPSGHGPSAGHCWACPPKGSACWPGAASTASPALCSGAARLRDGDGGGRAPPAAHRRAPGPAAVAVPPPAGAAARRRPGTTRSARLAGARGRPAGPAGAPVSVGGRARVKRRGQRLVLVAVPSLCGFHGPTSGMGRMRQAGAAGVGGRHGCDLTS